MVDFKTWTPKASHGFPGFRERSLGNTASNSGQTWPHGDLINKQGKLPDISAT